MGFIYLYPWLSQLLFIRELLPSYTQTLKSQPNTKQSESKFQLSIVTKPISLFSMKKKRTLAGPNYKRHIMHSFLVNRQFTQQPFPICLIFHPFTSSKRNKRETPFLLVSSPTNFCSVSSIKSLEIPWDCPWNQWKQIWQFNFPPTV